MGWSQTANTSEVNTRGDENTVSVDQNGSNSAEINQGMAGLGDAFGGEAIVVQDGTNNTARTNQNGSRNAAITLQTGTGNEAYVDQTGAFNNSNVAVFGNNNNCVVRQGPTP